MKLRIVQKTCAPLEGAKSAWYFLFNLHHTNILFGQIIGKRNREISETPKNRTLKVSKSNQQIVPFLSAAGVLTCHSEWFGGRLFLNPSLEGGLLLLGLFSPKRCSNSTIRSRAFINSVSSSAIRRSFSPIPSVSTRHPLFRNFRRGSPGQARGWHARGTWGVTNFFDN